MSSVHKPEFSLLKTDENEIFLEFTNRSNQHKTTVLVGPDGVSCLEYDKDAPNTQTITDLYQALLWLMEEHKAQ